MFIILIIFNERKLVLGTAHVGPSARLKNRQKVLNCKGYIITGILKDIFGMFCMQVCKYASVQVCKYASMQVWKYACIKVCKYASMQVCKYVSVRVCEYASM